MLFILSLSLFLSIKQEIVEKISLSHKKSKEERNQPNKKIFMAVEARRMNLLPSQFIIPNNRDFIKQNQGIVDICNHNKSNTQMTPATETPGLWPYAEVKPALPPEIVNNFTMYDWGKAESGLTSNNFQTAPTRKRTRRSVYDEPGGSFPRQLLDEEIITSHIQQQQSEIDRFIAIHREKMRMEMEVRKKRESGMLVRAIEERVVKKLKEKEEEIERMGKLNWVLQERVKRLCMENQVWRDLAESNEATVNSLRNNLEQVILAANNNVVAAEEAESCCGSTSDCGRTTAAEEEEEEEEEESSGGGGGRCRKCGAGESRVLVLPCRHLCLCTMCGSTLHTCPVCNSAINASVHVNFS